ncbi:sugar transferase [Streptococcus suis]|uniref:sugar transferase n=1 Tax=Streptococcus suis TaxID=1307 RepID=UPI00211D6822|nr:sugar transferase [Streptococcus suis]UUM58295.1 sugar transferase [Streptococcus suis]
MRVYITNLNGHAASSTAQIGQNMVTDLAIELGYREMGIYSYNMATDSPSELSKRLDGIVAGLSHGDVVIFQTPTWNSTEFDERLMAKLKVYQIKLVIFIHDVVPLMFESNYYLMKRIISYYNMADVLIAPSQRMIDLLRKEGLTVKKTLVQGMWDHPTKTPQLPATFQPLIHFPGSPARFGFIKQWNYSIKLTVYSNEEGEYPEQVTRVPYRPDEQLLLEMSRGGFGLVWMDDHDKGYQELYCPYKLGTFLAAGIPVIVQRGIANQEIIEANGLGLVVDSLDEAVEKIQTMTPADYQEFVTRVRSFNPLLRQGYFTKKLLVDAVFNALCQSE